MAPAEQEVGVKMFFELSQDAGVQANYWRVSWRKTYIFVRTVVLKRLGLSQCEDEVYLPLRFCSVEVSRAD